MSWRNQGITGSNNIPLGSRRRFRDEDSQTPPRDDGGYNPSQPSTGIAEAGYKRGRSPVKCKFYKLIHPLRSCVVGHLTQSQAEPPADGVRRRKKRNRWGDVEENKAAGLMGLPTMIMANMTNEQLEAYTLHLRIEEISQKLRINDVVPADGDRYAALPPYSFYLISLTI
jgi:splicing factor 1